ncbi:Mediator of RNA polymerase II transcription subunit 21 [Nowakowskiella sp. JEL0407]|nr:Mediator of RNA polymerase II transcription subunit 21 [Nowakowskiella sp. JEL0407]
MDKLTQLQDRLDKLSVMLYTSVGVLQRDAPLVPPKGSTIPVTAWTEQQVKERTETNQKFTKDVSRDIVSEVKTIELLINSLPGINMTEEEQLESLKNLEIENQELGAQMESAVKYAEMLLEQIRETLRYIAKDQMEFFQSEL